uniref:Uncharacterized protein n=1 Tax=Anopheles braziliensis TaxID=58242 RepID=A0A2M3ZM76_9DIPT
MAASSCCRSLSFASRSAILRSFSAIVTELAAASATFASYASRETLPRSPPATSSDSSISPFTGILVPPGGALNLLRAK